MMKPPESYMDGPATTHFISLIIPKPPPITVRQMTLAFYEISAATLDEFDLSSPTRRSYLSSIDRFVAERIRRSERIDRVLSLAHGTGRRMANIRGLSGKKFEVIGVDPSALMCEVSRGNGFETLLGHAEDLDELLPDSPKFDCAMFLYSFDHIPTQEWRGAALKGIFDRLRPGGLLFLDLFNLEDVTEWGSEITLLYRAKQLCKFGYDLGDAFYRRVGFHEHAFLHYFTTPEISALITSCGFEIEALHYVGYSEEPGRFDVDSSRGNIFITARKPL